MTGSIFKHRSGEDRIEERPRQLSALLILIVSGLVHVFLVASVLSQPLEVAAHPAERSIVWGLYVDSVHRAGPGADALGVYHAGRQVAGGGDPYSKDESPEVTPYFFQFRYLPVVAQTIGWAMIRLDPLWTWRSWAIITEIVLVSACFLIWKTTGDMWRRVTLLLPLLLSSPYLLELHMGQFTFVATTLAALGWASASMEKSRLRAVGGQMMFVLAALIKVYPLVALPAMLRDRRARAAGGLGLMAVILLTAPYFLQHRPQWSSFMRANFEAVPVLETGNFGLVQWVRMWTVVLGFGAEVTGSELWAGALRWGFLALATGAVLFAPRFRLMPAAALMLTAHHLGFPFTWEHHMSGVVVLAVAGAWDAFRDDTFRDGGGPFLTTNGWAVWGLATFLLVVPSPYGLFEPSPNPSIPEPGVDWPAGWLLALPAAKVIGTLLLAAWLLRRLGFWADHRRYGAAGELPSQNRLRAS